MANVGGPLTGTAGNDFLIGDALVLSVGVDNNGNSGAFALRGFAGDDILVGDIYDPLGPDTEGDEIFGGNGNDLIFGDTAPDLTPYGVVTSFDGDPVWALNGSSDKLYGEAGNDTIHGGGGFDQIYGGTGSDRIYGEADADYLYGDQSADRIWGGTGNDQVYGGAGIDVIFGEDGNDSLYGEDFASSAGDGGDTIKGGDGNDDIRGGAGADLLYGDRGDDTMTGGGLSSDGSNDLGDTCNGGIGNDFIYGNYGADVINGGAGLDNLDGGDGADIFVYRLIADSRRAAPDVISNFNSAAVDRIDVSAIDAIAGGLDDGFTFRGSSAFNGLGQIRAYTSGTDTFIDFNTTGTNAPDMRIVLMGIIAIDLADFVV